MRHTQSAGSPMASLHVVIFSQFFPPEMGAPAARFHDFGRLLIASGHRVTVVTGFPNSPSGVVPPEYRGRLRMEEEIDGIRVLRSWLFASPRLSAATKSLGFASFAASSALRALFSKLEPDVVVATSPPPTAAIGGILAHRRFRVPLVFDVRDIWPEAIAFSGRLRSRWLIRSLERLEMRLYDEAAIVSVVTEGKKTRLIEKGVAAQKIRVIPNGLDLSQLDDAPDAEPLLVENGVDPGRFLVVYAGVFNPPQGLDVLIDAAAHLRHEKSAQGRRVQIVLIGGGSERDRLRRRCKDEDLEDMVVFVPIQPRARILSCLTRADAVAVTLRPRRDSHTVPSKLYEAMASGSPVLVSADGAPAEILREAQAGLATAASDAGALAGSIRSLVDDPEQCEALGAAGKRFAARFDRRNIVRDFEKLLQEAASGGASAGEGA